MPNITVYTFRCPAHSHLRHTPEDLNKFHIMMSLMNDPLQWAVITAIPRFCIRAVLRRTRAISTCPRRDDTCNRVSSLSKPRVFTSSECSVIRNVAISCMPQKAASCKGVALAYDRRSDRSDRIHEWSSGSYNLDCHGFGRGHEAKCDVSNWDGGTS
jgi:hypothetical protein